MDQGKELPIEHKGNSWNMAVNNHWTVLLEWTTGMDYWNGILD